MAKPSVSDRIERAYRQAVRLLTDAQAAEARKDHRAADWLWRLGWKWSDHHNALCFAHQRGAS